MKLISPEILIVNKNKFGKMKIFKLTGYEDFDIVYR